MKLELTEFLETKVSVVVPMFNEEENVEPLISEIHIALQHLPDYEIVVVDDCSRDQTLAKLLALKTRIPNLHIVKHAQNSGQSAGVVTGVKNAKFPWIATLDGDGQNDPSDILKLLITGIEYVKKGQLTLIAGYRNQRKDTILKRVSSRIANRVRSFLLKDDCPDTGCGLKVFSRDVFLTIPHFNHVHRFLPALFRRQGFDVINVPIQHRPRLHGQSKYGVMNRLWVGIVDLFGVAWLQRRPCYPQVDIEER